MRWNVLVSLLGYLVFSAPALADAHAPSVARDPGLRLMGSASTGWGGVSAISASDGDGFYAHGDAGLLLGGHVSATYRSRRGFELGSDLGLRYIAHLGAATTPRIREDAVRSDYYQLEPLQITTVSAVLGGHWPVRRATFGFVFTMGLAIVNQNAVDDFGAGERVQIVALGAIFSPELVIEAPLRERLAWRLGVSTPMGIALPGGGGGYLPVLAELRFGIVWGRAARRPSGPPISRTPGPKTPGRAR